MNILLQVKDNIKPKANDVIVYDDKNECWKVITKATLFSEMAEEIKELKKEDAVLENEIASLNNKLGKLAEIVKEKL